ncbi:MAG TPA: translation initiation factor IF-2 [Thermosynechococcaceae cyanobacterium]
MNSGKVRIYELSRELNLDNKDLLAVCEQLNISVKSHSSTITDSEAEQIRTEAEKQAAHRPAFKPAQPRQGSSPQSMESRTKTPAPPVQKKQQILEIRKPITRPASSEPPTADVPTATPPSPPAKPAAPPTRPQFSSPEPIAPSVIETAPIAADAETHLEQAHLEQAESEPTHPEQTHLEQAKSEPTQPKPPAPSAVRPSVVEAAPPSVEVEQPELVEPPARQTIAAHTAKVMPSANRPVLKRAGSGQSAPEAAPTRERVERPAAPSAARLATSPTAPRPARPQTIVELRRPRPVRPEEDTAARAGAPAGEVTILKDRPRQPVPDLNRPTRGEVPESTVAKPTLAGARTKKKGWREEEEDVQESSEKAASIKSAKTKRRTQTDVEDEDDIDLDGSEDDANSPVQVSLSLMRPAKPKSTRQAQVRTPVMVAAPRARKSSSFRDRRDRREEAKPEKPEKITLTRGLTVQELSLLLLLPETDIIRALFMKGIAATVTQTLDIVTATTVAVELGVEVEAGEKVAAARKVTEMLDVEDLESLQRRPPVVTIMGHVDHGKTTLLDSIRKTKVAQGEAGGITQHIGAYHVDVEHNGEMEQVVFLDTPGHEAFTAMRARGARVTDIAVLVVAADDGVQPQTIEAIRHAQAAEVPIVVAINKIDKEGAQPDRVKQELTEYSLVPEEWGGETIMVPVSAINGENLDTLLEMILLVSEVEDLNANPDRAAKGTVIEAHLDKAKGPVATLLIQNGTLHVGDTLVAGSVLGKVRAMVDDRGARVKIASPSFAVEVLGLNDVPAAGDEFDVFADEKEARAVASDRSDEQRQSRLLQAMSSRRVSLNTISARAQEGDLKELNLVLKADVQGSVEAILGSLKQLPQNEVQVRVLYAAPGEISETDVDLAAASDAVIIGFNTTLATGARQAADREGVDVREYNIIYKLLDDIQAAMEGLLEPELVEEALGQVEVRAVFPVGRGAVAGCYVLSGKIIRNCKIRVRRNGEMLHEGSLDSLKRMKEDAREVNAGYECGIGLDNFSAWEVNDIIEAYRMIAKRRTLSAVK